MKRHNRLSLRGLSTLSLAVFLTLHARSGISDTVSITGAPNATATVDSPDASNSATANGQADSITGVGGTATAICIGTGSSSLNETAYATGGTATNDRGVDGGDASACASSSIPDLSDPSSWPAAGSDAVIVNLSSSAGDGSLTSGSTVGGNGGSATAGTVAAYNVQSDPVTVNAEVHGG